jgi:uncharacterized protein DUF6755
MSPKARLRERLRVVLNMVMGFVVMILLAQLWLFTVTLEAMETRGASVQVAVAAMFCSSVACVAVWVLIRFFLKNEEAGG